MRSSVLRGCVFLLLLGATACGQANTAEAPLHVYAAASLTDVLEALHPGMEQVAARPVRITTASSATLARQIQHGAPADIFISANPAWMTHVADAGLLARDAQPWLKNRLACVVHRDGAWTPAGPADLTAPALTTLALAAETAPVGAYARDALAAAQVQLRVRVVEGLNARDTLAKVALGGAQAGIVYATDVRLEPRVRIAFIFDAHLHPRIEYPVGILARTVDASACTRVVEYLRSRDAREILVARGFDVL